MSDEVLRVWLDDRKERKVDQEVWRQEIVKTNFHTSRDELSMHHFVSRRRDTVLALTFALALGGKISHNYLYVYL